MDILVDIWKTIKSFGDLPDWAKLIVFLLSLCWAFWSSLQWIMRQRELKANRRELQVTEAALKDAQNERDQLVARFQALDRIDTHVWKKPDAHNKNRFVPPEQRKTRFLALCNLKGGVGKTTLTLNLGATLAQAGKTVLLVDLDFQGTLSNLAMDPSQLRDCREKGWCTDALLSAEGSGDVRRLMFRAKDVSAVKLMLARESLELVEFEQQSRFFVNPGIEVRFLLQEMLHAPAVLQEFDYVLFDCPPRMSTACINALTCADYVLIPTALTPLDVEAVPRTLRWLKELHGVVQASFIGAVITRGRMRGGKLVSYELPQLSTLKERIRDQHPIGEFVFDAMIPDNPEIHRLTAEGKSVTVYSKQGRAWFEAIGKELERKVRT